MAEEMSFQSELVSNTKANNGFKNLRLKFIKNSNFLSTLLLITNYKYITAVFLRLLR